MIARNALTVPMCLNFCYTARRLNGSSRGFRYAGVEWSHECWCSDELSHSSISLADSACQHPCEGDNRTACGGPLALSVYNLTQNTPQEPSDPKNSTHSGDGKGSKGSQGGKGPDFSSDAVLQGINTFLLLLNLIFITLFWCL
ncbi:hypothetical protein GGS23DRAFT_574822 [Durotheca rogersii]|uniref:uncharacterized protein n=1 Tax=Durotheca rogersii TaxID=419775 RepID=UPI002220EFED|nr:uncharacterized protein GGS23DRAFT_574822 [Durotheca rogersii]KAI5861764.1 hypothetical protein GGS23DRAFT_574822 [Durotheca rogersii]